MAIDVEGETISSWDSFTQLVSTEFPGRWHFRGALDDWSLEPSLERAARDAVPRATVDGYEYQI